MKRKKLNIKHASKRRKRSARRASPRKRNVHGEKKQKQKRVLRLKRLSASASVKRRKLN